MRRCFRSKTALDDPRLAVIHLGCGNTLAWGRGSPVVDPRSGEIPDSVP